MIKDIIMREKTDTFEHLLAVKLNRSTTWTCD
jgi:hypothetical protein